MRAVFKWIPEDMHPKPGNALLCAVSPLTGKDEWVYMFGSYFEEGDVFHTSKSKVTIKKAGYFAYSEKLDKLLPLETVRYWTYIPEPADISDELVIMRGE